MTQDKPIGKARLKPPTVEDVRQAYINRYIRIHNGEVPSDKNVDDALNRLLSARPNPTPMDPDVIGVSKSKTIFPSKVREVAGTDQVIADFMAKTTEVVKGKKGKTRIKNLTEKIANAKKVPESREEKFVEGLEQIDSFLHRLKRAEERLNMDSPMMGSIVELPTLNERMTGLAKHWMTDLSMISENTGVDIFNAAQLTIRQLEANLSKYMTSLQNS